MSLDASQNRFAHKAIRLAAVFCFFSPLTGCSGTSEDNRIDDPPDLADPGERHGSLPPSDLVGPSNGPVATPNVEPKNNLDTQLAESSQAMFGTGDVAPISQGIVGDSTPQPEAPPLGSRPATEPSPPTPTVADAQPENENPVTPFQLAPAVESAIQDSSDGRKLAADLTPKELVGLLASADRDMQLILSGRSQIADEREARSTLNQIVDVKLQAARRLTAHADASEKDKSIGARGEQQALSHLASQGDLKSAEALEQLANRNLSSEDSLLAAESRVVLVGFAIEALQAGKKGAAERVVSLVKQIESNDEQPDVPAMMVMGHARELLAKYGHDEEAAFVRERIIDLFANSPNPEIAKLAAQVAGNVRFDVIERLRASVIKDETVSVTRWRESVEDLISEAPDLITVQYLAGTALEFEGIGQDELAAEIYDILNSRFTNPDEATGREVQMASAAKQARARVIGRVFDPDLPAINGSPLLMKSFRGKIVLMPFWASGFPESLQVVPMLRRLQEANPDDIAIVGMNLDPDGPQLEAFMQNTNLGFRSYHAVSSATQRVANPVAAQFGMVSMPFVVIIDQNGKIVALDFTGRKLEATVASLLKGKDN